MTTIQWLLVLLSASAFAAESHPPPPRNSVRDCNLNAIRCVEQCKENEAFADERRRACNAECAADQGQCLAGVPAAPPPPVEPAPPIPAPPPPAPAAPPVLEAPAGPSTRFEGRQALSFGYDDRGTFAQGTGELEFGARLYFTPLPEDPTRHRRITEFLEHPSFLDVSIGGSGLVGGGFPSVIGRLYLTRTTGLALGLHVPTWQPAQLRPQVGVLQYVGRSLLLEAHASFGFTVERPADHFVTLTAGASFLAGARWLPSLWAHYAWSTFLRSSSVTLTMQNRFFLTPRLALGVDLTGSVTSPVEVVLSFDPTLQGNAQWVTTLRTRVHLGVKASLEWEWNRWFSSAVTATWSWTRAGEFPPWWWVGPGFDVRVRF